MYPSPGVLSEQFVKITLHFNCPLLKSTQAEASLVAPVYRESMCNAGDPGLIPGLTRSPGERNGNHSTILAWEILWTKEPGGLQSQRAGHDLVTETHPHNKYTCLYLSVYICVWSMCNFWRVISWWWVRGKRKYFYTVLSSSSSSSCHSLIL